MSDSCGAGLNNGELCQNPKVPGRSRCNRHGCSPGSGGQPGNKNARKHGRRSKKAINQSLFIRSIVEKIRSLMFTIESLVKE